MPEKEWNSEFEKLKEECWQLIWPTNSLIHKQTNSRRKCLPKYSGAYKSQICKSKFSQGQDDDSSYNSDDDNVNNNLCGSMLFFHPKTFYLMEPDIHSQFYTYKPNYFIMESLCNCNFNFFSISSPHNKSYSRYMQKIDSKTVLSSNAENNSDEHDECVCYDLAWFLLTSACLSKGLAHQKLLTYLF
jgi:hypothetical protein